MRHHYSSGDPFGYEPLYAKTYQCDHLVYDSCTLYLDGEGKGLAVIRQFYDPKRKATYWTDLRDAILADEIYLNGAFKEYFAGHADHQMNGLYPTVNVRQIMWALRMKPLPKERWETVFDRRFV